MYNNLTRISRPFGWLMVFLLVQLLCALPVWVIAHPMPNSVVLLDIQTNRVRAELRLPLSELELAFGHEVTKHPETVVARLDPDLRTYLRQHVRPVSTDGRPWIVTVGELAVQPAQQGPAGPYYELTAVLWLQPPTGSGLRQFTLNYDVIIHQLVTHVALVSIRQDWDRGVIAEHPIEVGVIRLDVVNNVVPPLIVRQSEGSMWQGFQTMVNLGIRHIAEGTDHLLFLLVLLLPAPLLSSGRRWSRAGGVGYSLSRLLLIVTAFTAGHSITLLAGALGWLRLPSQPVEVIIAFSILVAALHAMRPIFPRREAYVAAAFGLVHGLAFAGTLTNLSLDPGRMALSILGFNVGIELMQLLVIILTIPWLLLLSRTRVYEGVRIAGAVFAGIAALAWIEERLLGQTNALTGFVERVAQYAPWLMVALATAAISITWLERINRRLGSVHPNKESTDNKLVANSNKSDR